MLTWADTVLVGGAVVVAATLTAAFVVVDATPPPSAAFALDQVQPDPPADAAVQDPPSRSGDPAQASAPADASAYASAPGLPPQTHARAQGSLPQSSAQAPALPASARFTVVTGTATVYASAPASERGTSPVCDYAWAPRVSVGDRAGGRVPATVQVPGVVSGVVVANGRATWTCSYSYRAEVGDDLDSAAWVASVPPAVPSSVF